MANTVNFQSYGNSYTFDVFSESILRSPGFASITHLLAQLNLSDHFLVQTPAANWITRRDSLNLSPLILQNNQLVLSNDAVWPRFWNGTGRRERWAKKSCIITDKIIITPIILNKLPTEKNRTYIITSTDLHRIMGEQNSNRRIKFNENIQVREFSQFV